MIAEIECVGLSRDTLVSSIQPLHERILEVQPLLCIFSYFSKN